MTRDSLITRFLETEGWSAADRQPLAGDASFRCYERLRCGEDSAILMNAPPPDENIRPYLQIAQYLSFLGYSVPIILATDKPNGLALLEDFGDDTYTSILASGGDTEILYTLALDLLIDLHQRFRGDWPISAYGDEQFIEEATLFVDWYLPAVRGTEVSESSRSEFMYIWRSLLPIARDVPTSLVLRDYHAGNLMVLRERGGLNACGLLDFQDAVVGPVTYDIVSLLEDARLDVAPLLSNKLIARYLNAFPMVDHENFSASYNILGAQRSMKIIGIFTRLDRRDGKPIYIKHIPRVWRWLHQDLAHPTQAPLAAWLDRELPASLRTLPRILTKFML